MTEHSKFLMLYYSFCTIKTFKNILYILTEWWIGFGLQLPSADLKPNFLLNNFWRNYFPLLNSYKKSYRHYFCIIFRSLRDITEQLGRLWPRTDGLDQDPAAQAAPGGIGLTVPRVNIPIQSLSPGGPLTSFPLTTASSEDNQEKDNSRENI